MPQPNPYAPPGADPAAPGRGASWYPDGTGVLALDGTVLPEVDLVTGAADGGLVRVRRAAPRKRTPGQLFACIAFGFLFPWVTRRGVSPVWVVVAILAVQFLWRQIVLLRNGPDSGGVWVYCDKPAEAARLLGKRLRQRLGGGLAVVFFLCFIYSTEWAEDFGLGVYSAGLLGAILVLVGLAVWQWLDRGKPQVTRAQPGWLRLEPVHPAALAILARVAGERDARESLARPRRVFTEYLYRQPLACLVGTEPGAGKRRLRILLMKLMRSRLLEHVSYHFSEATPVSVDEVSGMLRQESGAFLSAHPDWRPLFAERMGTPTAGRLTDGLVTETVFITAPDHSSTLMLSTWRISRSFGATRPLARFSSTLADGTRIITSNQPLAPLAGCECATRVGATPDGLCEWHVQRCTGRNPLAHDSDEYARAALEENRAWELERKREKGYVSAVREEG